RALAHQQEHERHRGKRRPRSVSVSSACACRSLVHGSPPLRAYSNHAPTKQPGRDQRQSRFAFVARQLGDGAPASPKCTVAHSAEVPKPIVTSCPPAAGTAGAPSKRALIASRPFSRAERSATSSARTAPRSPFGSL